jgi:hypothetical protein
VRRLTCLFVFAAAAILASAAFAADQHALDGQMTRIIQLEALDDWCAAAHDMDYDRLREAIQTERERALAMTDSERDLRLSYSRAKTIFLLGISSPTLFCEIMYRAKNRPGFAILRGIFRD